MTNRLLTTLGMVAIAVLLLARPANAASIAIQFTGLDVVYDGGIINDAGLPIPAGADPLSTMDFFADGVLVGSLAAPDISANVGLFLGAPNIPVGGGDVSALGGVFDLLTSVGDLELDVDWLRLRYSGGQLLGKGSASIFSQALPFGLVMSSAPVEISFLLNVDPASITDNGTFLTGFTASGIGAAVPEPAPLLLLLLGTGITVAGRRLRRTRSVNC